MTPTNNEWLSKHTGNPTFGKHHSEGKIVWKIDNKVTKSFWLGSANAKKLRKMCGEADRKEAFANLILDVWVEKIKGDIVMSIRNSSGKEV